MLRVENLTKKYREFKAVDNITFHVKKGEVVGFLGPNGAGKTTTMKILTCFLPPTEGTAFIAGMNIYENSLEIRKRIGYLPENAPLYMDMGVIEYLRYIAEIRRIPVSQINQRIKEVTDICGLGKVFKKDIYELSKGYRQRVGLAQTLIHGPDILILDEPTSGLDPNQIIEIRNLIKNIGKEKTILLSTHILPEVEATCNRVIIINKGKIVAQGTTAELSAGTNAESALVATFKGAHSATEIESKLKEKNFVTSFKLIQSQPNSFRFNIRSQEKEIGEEIFKLAVANRWSLTELFEDRVSLEEVFRQLTSS